MWTIIIYALLGVLAVGVVTLLLLLFVKYSTEEERYRDINEEYKGLLHDRESWMERYNQQWHEQQKRDKTSN